MQTNTETPVLQITSLHGDVVATAALSETETKLLSTSDTTEYGVPRTGTSPPKYSWLGADALQTELPTGVIAMGARSYVPQVGRFLQTDPRPGGSADAYAYTFGDPVNASDPSGEWTFATPGWLTQFDGEWAAGGEAREAARLAAARVEAERIARQAAEEAASTAAANAELAEWTCANTWGGCGGGGEPEQLGGSEGWACEYAAETGQEAAGCGINTEWLGTIGGGATIASSIFTEGWNWVKTHAKKIVAVAASGLATAVIGTVTLVAAIGCDAGTDGLDSFECYKIAVFGAGFTVAAAGATVKAWYETK